MTNFFKYDKREIASAAYIIIFILIYGSASASNNVKKFKSVEFKDLYYLSKYEIIDRAGIRIDGSDIIVDMDLLRKALIEQPMVNTFKLSEQGGRLSISVHENEPVFLCGFRNGDDLFLFEADANFRILSTGQIHAVNMPLVIIDRADVQRNNLSDNVKNFLGMIRSFSKGRLSGLLQEIDEIDLTDLQRAEIRLKGRKTLFAMAPFFENFVRLNGSAGYFDRIRYYPVEFEITSALGVIKKR
ncbi:MAG: hypothetical protein MUC95_01080 [Spirochaetes bacterium]|jgi:hypothetical protein|nr:hypothetical protein [Spirochaetota bacterium]